ncbi:MAG: CPBP family intramembrane metalloprotease [Acidobacteriaceae bacterium]|nr:CPBP family intramembrane metalloprotease [Acidobacteriaceae bacterium]
MNQQPSLTTIPPAPADTRWGVVLRLAFFIASVIIGLRLFTYLLYVMFGVLVAGAVGLCATALFANVLTMKIFDRRPLVDIGLKLGRASGRNFALGVIFGAGAAALMLAAPLLAGTGHLVTKQHSDFTWGGLVFYLAILFIAAAGEEMIFRGYGFQLLIEKIGPFATILPVSVVFGFAHASNPGSTWIAVCNTILWGFLLGYAFFRSHDLWLPIGLHFGWNAVLPLFGVNLSGLTIDVTRYYYRWDLLPIWSGGNYGPEGGLLTTIFAIGLFFALRKAPVVPQEASIARVLNDTF